MVLDRLVRGEGSLVAVIGEQALVALAEAFGGTRLNVPVKVPPDHEIAQAIGPEAALRLSAAFAPDVLRVPLARELRAAEYRKRGARNAQIAVKLGMAESGVEKLFKRLREQEQRPDATHLHPDLATTAARAAVR